MMHFTHTGAHWNKCIFVIKDKNLAQGHKYKWLFGFIAAVLNHQAIDPV